MTLSLARRAERFPDRPAVVDVSEERLYAPAETVHEDRVSYAELSRLAAETAARLSTLEVDAGDTVCLVTRNRVASLALLFACRRLGATLAPISHLLTPVTVERPFDALEPEFVVAEAAQRDLVRSIPFDRSVTLEELAAVDPNDDPVTDADDVAVGAGSDSATGGAERPLVCLHGEGGRPVVGYTARALEWNCITSLVAWGLSGTDVGTLTAPLSTVGGLVRTAFPLLYAGGRLLLDRAFDPGDALAAIENERATVLVGRRSALRDLAAESGFDDAVDSLERVLADASVPDDVIAAYRKLDVPVARVYGRLECPIALCEPLKASSDDERTGEDTPVGYPAPDCRVCLVDEAGDVLEGAGTGRLQLAGPVLADGYVDAPVETGDRDAPDDRTDGRSDETGDRGDFVNGWFDTGRSVRRDVTGTYYVD
ncbi:class I adenylate-forming enzyme family protein [Halopiger djelfimassiliensis]|uniref:class I adenylate-forming enzyme family protein n=1 Tax=Halopiger djelfimassiliensis TaxID=1293047 RepID=UPI000677D66E|nr:class I adenylate-forming enzyme family protein [Halopiger djelfimassiliensis]